MPFFQQERQHHEIGLFGQDAWTIGRVTVNLGLRWDYITMGFPAADLPAGRYVPARHVDELKGVPEWSDINPRLGTSIDVLGNGRTAVKVSFGRYNQLSRSDMTRRFHPFTSSVNTAFRDWNDANGNYIPDCDLTNFAPNGECDRMTSEFFGQFIPLATIFDDSVIKDNRDFLWDFVAQVQHEVVRGLSVSFEYNRNWTGVFQVTDNTLVGPQDYDEFCITVPNDPRLPNAGQQQCGFYDVKPQFLGRGQLRVTDSREFGKQERYWDGFAINANGRLRGMTMSAGVDFGRQVDDHCFTVDIPNQPPGIGGSPPATSGAELPGGSGPFCRIVTSWANNLDFRMRGSVPLPYGFSAGFVYRNTPGAVVNASLAVPRSQVRFLDPARTAPLTTASRTVPLYMPNSVYGDRFTQLDVGLNRVWDIGWARLTTRLDLYNALNASSIQQVVNVYSTRWQLPTQFMPARLMRITGTLAF